jgi:uncharacterized membrane protein YraQ (UPF0718 family)
MRVLGALGHALGLAGSMTWQITWSLILGFTLSAIVQALVRRATVIRLLGDDRPKTLATATGLGAASSSCSYAAVALARSLFRKGASFTATVAFEIASTNLVIELGIILALLLSWQFTLAEFTGGPIMIILVAVAFRLFVRPRLIDAAREQADRGLTGSMEGHAAMDMSIRAGGSFRRRLASREGITSVSHIFVMEWAAVIRDIAGGLLIAGAIAAWVPDTFWRHLFLTGDPLAARWWGPVIGPVISLLSFVCSIGNVPLAAVLWNGGISFGGVVAFIFADLIIIPILIIYRKYYGTRMMLAIAGIFYAAMVLAGYVVEFAFGGLGLIPATRAAKVTETGVQWNYTTVLNIIFLLLAAALLIRSIRSGGIPMLKAMGGGPDADDRHAPGGPDRHAPGQTFHNLRCAAPPCDARRRQRGGTPRAAATLADSGGPQTVLEHRPMPISRVARAMVRASDNRRKLEGDMGAPVTDEQWNAVCGSLRTTAGRFYELVSSIPDPGTGATVKWSVADIVAHIASIAWMDTTLMRAAAEPVPFPDLDEALAATKVDDVHGFNDRVLSHFTEHNVSLDLSKLREHIDLMLTASQSRDRGETYGWLGGARLTLAGMLAHMVNELLIHGNDIAQAVKVPWAMPPADAAHFFELFFMGLASGDMGHILEGGKRPSKRRIAVEFRSGYTTPITVVVCDGRVSTEPIGAGADVKVRFDPAALNMMLFGRISKYRAILTGKIIVSGRRPWLILPFLRTIRAPS